MVSTTAQVKAGDKCDINKDRITCASEKAMLFCNQNEWVAFSDCEPGTVCRDGRCQVPDQDSGSASNALPSQANDSSDLSSVAAVSDPAAAASDTAAIASDTAAAVSDTAAAASDTAAEASDTAAASDTEAASSADESSQSGNDSSSGSSGDNFGITCDKFNDAVSKASKAISANYPAPSSAQCNSFLKGMSKGDISSAREAAMFLSNILWESDGLRAKEEYDCKDLPDWCAQNYKSTDDKSGQTYWGRGYIQLTWSYNYKAASEGLYGDDRLLDKPDQVATDEDTAWAVSFWFWKANVHSDPGVQQGNFGSSINKINGALECKGAAQDKAKKRYEMYKAVLPVFAPGEQPKESGCYN
ncbi:hypothetical protein LPJ63_000807 [Coemansia sp. RSA 2711]|nr:hypothetical protein LPJ63_000807 [Coemansia sp. RSA 2711]